jgi:putative transposase
LKVARQRNDFAAKAASTLVRSNDLVAYEDLQVDNMVRSHHRAKSISDAAWSAFLQWLRYYGKVFGKITVAVPAAYTSQDCSACGRRVPKDAGETVHRCPCGAVLDRDLNAARNILQRALRFLSEMDGSGGHPRTGEARLPNAWGDPAATAGQPCRKLGR